MQLFIEHLIEFFRNVFQVLDSYYFTLFGSNVSIFSLMIAILIFGFLIAVFWKGAKS